ncbi:MAG: clan AA aspartic protease [Planctomycetes bacterium]|nr:clan AA aspartic protease [Planctomycetota bacterium]
MIGRVSSGLEAIVPVVVGPAGGPAMTLACILDTGFDGFVALAPSQMAALGLRPAGTQRVTLGDGSEAHLPLYNVPILWHGRRLAVPALEVEGAPLLGMALLHGSEVGMQVVEGGFVRIEPIPES